MKLASEMIVDAVVPGERLRVEICVRLERCITKHGPRPGKKHSVAPV